MENINLNSIKRESIKAIYNSIASEEKISRADISAQTGLSLMTVGKVVDALLNLNIIRQFKEIKSAAGRKAGLISTNTDNFCVILDLTSHNFTMIIINVKLQFVDKLNYTYNNDFYFEENLYIFLKNADLYLSRNMDMENCIGIGVSVPGPYEPSKDIVINSRIPELETIQIKSIISSVLHHDSIFIESSVNVAAISNIRKIPDYKEKVICYWFVGDYISGAVVVNGEIIHGFHNFAGNFGQTIVSRGKTLENAMKELSDIEDASYELSKALHNVIKIIDPHVIILECEIFNKSEVFIEHVQKFLLERFKFKNDQIPEIISGKCSCRHSHRGLALKLREQWLDKVISCQI